MRFVFLCKFPTSLGELSSFLWATFLLSLCGTKFNSAIVWPILSESTSGTVVGVGYEAYYDSMEDNDEHLTLFHNFTLILYCYSVFKVVACLLGYEPTLI